MFTALQNNRTSPYFFAYEYDRFKSFIFKPENEIPLGSKYVVFINAEAEGYAFAENSFKFLKKVATTIVPDNTFKLSDRVLADSALGLVHFVITINRETYFDDTDIDYPQLLRSLEVANGSQVTITTAVDLSYSVAQEAVQRITQTYGVNIVYDNGLYLLLSITDSNNPRNPWMFDLNADNQFYHTFSTYVNQKFIDIKNRNRLQFKGVMYNRVTRQHRLLTLAYLRYKDYMQDTIFSWHNKTIPFDTSRTKLFFPELETDIDYFVNLKNKPAQFENEEVLNSYVPNTIVWKHGDRSSFHLISESAPSKDYYLYTEKSFKPMFLMQPFIMIGGMNSVDMLRKLGYNTFEKWIDHSYDAEYDPVRRMRLVFKELDRLYSMSNEQIADMLYDMRYDLMENVQRVTTPMYERPSNNLFPIMDRFFNG